MSKIVLVNESEFLEPADYNRFGSFAREADDAIVGAAVAYPAHWSGFTLAKKSLTEVQISAGLYFEGSIVYADDEGETINMTAYLPLAASDERWVAILARGDIGLINEDRSFETSQDPETSEPVVISTPVVSSRDISYTVQVGLPSPPPAAYPTIAGTDACLAFVRLTTEGVQEILPGENWRVKSLYEVEGRLTIVEGRVTQLFEDTETIRTDVGNIAAETDSLKQAIPNARLFEQIVRDTARHSQVLNLPDEARNYWFNQALLDEDWDFTAGGFFRIDEGIRYQYVAQSEAILRPLNMNAPEIKPWEERLLLPDYEEVTRITSPTGAGKRDIAGVVHTITTATKKTVSHTRYRYGATVTVCENTAGWTQLGSLKAGQQFKKDGETWVSKGQTSNPWNQTETAKAGHAEYAVQRLIKDTVTKTYVTYNTEEFGLSGAIHGETFLCAQVMVATSVDLNFTKVDPVNGDVIFCLAEIDASGAPDYQSVLAVMTKPRSQLVQGWNRFHFEPTLLEQGKRYSWFVTTTGNHQLMTNTGNAFSGGSMFISSDGIWSQGSVTEDFTFRLNAAKFKAARTVIPFESLALTGGMTEIDMIYKAWEPAATAIVWEVKPQGSTTWIPFDAREDNPLYNLPPLVQLRAVFIGTEDVAPAMVIDAYTRAVAGRMRPDMRAITDLLPFGFATTSAQVILNMDNFNAAKHTASAKLILSNGTVVEPDGIVPEIDPSKLTRTKFTANFTLPGGTVQARVRVDSTTTDVTDVPFGQDVQANFF